MMIGTKKMSFRTIPYYIPLVGFFLFLFSEEDFYSEPGFIFDFVACQTLGTAIITFTILLILK